MMPLRKRQRLRPSFAKSTASAAPTLKRGGRLNKWQKEKKAEDGTQKKREQTPTVERKRNFFFFEMSHLLVAV
jgi:hypothetical protein